jgi:hypothetical protein
MKNLSGQEVGIEVGMIIKDSQGRYNHIKAIIGEQVVYGIYEETITEAINAEPRLLTHERYFHNHICVGYHNPMGVDKNGEVVHKGDLILVTPTMSGNLHYVNGEHGEYFFLEDNNFACKKQSVLNTKNPLRCQQEKTPEQIEEEKAIELLTKRGRIRDGKVIV